MKKGSLRLRLFAAGAASIVVALTVAGGGLLLLFERHVERRVVAELETDLRQLIGGLALGANGALEVARPPAEPLFDTPLSGSYWQITPLGGGPLLRSRSLWDTVLALPQDDLTPGQEHLHDLLGPGGAMLLAAERSVRLPASLGGVQIRAVVAVDRSVVTTAARAFATDLLPALGLLALILAAAAWVQVTVGLRPLDAVRRRLAAVREGRMPRLGNDFPDEVRPLALEVDTLLDAQEAAMMRARARAADLAHGLKTPLTVLATTAEDLRARGDAAIADEINGVADGMRRHVERELARARVSHATRSAVLQPVAPVIGQVVGVLRRTPRGQELDWAVDAPASVAAAVDPQDMAEMLGNLAENAVKWAQTQVTVTAVAAPDGCVVAVEDDGPGIAEDDMPVALARGGRLDESRPGTGLGLAIVTDLVEAYGGALALGRSGLGGLHAAIRLPLRH
ncbi:MAG: HAMP domain-containing histidine kinase [Proteobacteria bacterium]|nr:HAMP domain-containing histidine kinase [Pseudomonadota bacterium]